jgi:hypothetical protein
MLNQPVNHDQPAPPSRRPPVGPPAVGRRRSARHRKGYKQDEAAENGQPIATTLYPPAVHANEKLVKQPA